MGAAAARLIPRDADDKLAAIVAEVAAPVKVPVPEVIPSADDLGRVHFVGIGGAGLSGIARVMLARGIPVSGSDAVDSPTLAALRVARCAGGARP